MTRLLDHTLKVRVGSADTGVHMADDLRASVRPMMPAGIISHSARSASSALALKEEAQYKEVRGLTRGLALLRALNHTPGGAATTSALANACGIHRTTAKRLLETLRTAGLVRVGVKEGYYMLSQEVLHLSVAMQRMRWIPDALTPLLEQSAAALAWPCEFATYEAGQMVLRESTHRWRRFAKHTLMFGQTVKVTRSALGQAYVAGCTPEEFERVLAELRTRSDGCGELARDPHYVGEVLAQARARRWAESQRRRTGDRVIAVPVRAMHGMLGAVNMSFPAQLVDGEAVEQRLLPMLRDLAGRIAAAYDQWHEAEAQVRRSGVPPHSQFKTRGTQSHDRTHLPAGG